MGMRLISKRFLTFDKAVKNIEKSYHTTNSWNHINLNRLTMMTMWDVRTQKNTKKKTHQYVEPTQEEKDWTAISIYRIEPFYGLVSVFYLILFVSLVFFLLASLKYDRIIRTARAYRISDPMWHLSHMSGLFSSFTSFIFANFFTRLSSMPFIWLCDKSNSCKQCIWYETSEYVPKVISLFLKFAF